MRHDLRDKLLFALKELIGIRIKGSLCNVTVKVNLGIGVTLSHDSTCSLFKVSGSPRNVKVVKCNESLLHIRAGSHLEGGTHKHSYLSTANLCKEFFLLCVGICRVNESDLLGRYSTLNELVSDVIVNIETAIILWCGKVAEYKLCRFLIRILFPNLVDVLNASVDLTSIIN